MIALFAAAIAVYTLVGVVVLAARRPGYQHTRNTISELGEHGAPGAVLASWGLFAPVGLGLLALAWEASKQLSPNALDTAFVHMCAAVGIGYAGSALFPCDPGSPLIGTWRQQAHNMVSAVAYVGGAAAMLNAGLAEPQPQTRIALLVLGCAVGLLTLLLGLPRFFPVRGGLQRIAEVTLFGSILALALSLG